MNRRHDSQIHMIPIDQITVLNPRQRGKKKFRQIINNIGQLGLKKPVTVALSRNGDGKTKYITSSVARAALKPIRHMARLRSQRSSSTPRRRISC